MKIYCDECRTQQNRPPVFLERYSGTASGPVLVSKGKYRRREDLSDPMFIQYLP